MTACSSTTAGTPRDLRELLAATAGRGLRRPVRLASGAPGGQRAARAGRTSPGPEGGRRVVRRSRAHHRGDGGARCRHGPGDRPGPPGPPPPGPLHLGGVPAMRGAPGVAIVVPCFDEAERLDPDGLVELAKRASAGVVLVDDGSTDGTRSILQRLVDTDPDRFTLLALPANVGKGESVAAVSSTPWGRGGSSATRLRPAPLRPRWPLARRCRSNADSVCWGPGLAPRHSIPGPWWPYLGRVFATVTSCSSGVCLRHAVRGLRCSATVQS